MPLLTLYTLRQLIEGDFSVSSNSINVAILTPKMVSGFIRPLHPTRYKRTVEKALKKLEDQCIHYCKDDNQQQLIKKLDKLSNKVKTKIEGWSDEYLIHNANQDTKERLKQMLVGAKK